MADLVNYGDGVVFTDGVTDLSSQNMNTLNTGIKNCANAINTVNNNLTEFKNSIGTIRAASPSESKSIANGGTLFDITIFSGTWLIFAYAGGNKILLQDNDTTHALYLNGINVIGTYAVPTGSTKNINVLNNSGSNFTVYADGSNYYLRAIRISG